jgi:phage tail protein X
MNVENVVAREGDTVDIIAFKRFGAHGMEDAIWEGNPGLAAIGPILPAGTIVLIPLPEVADRTQSTRLWD